ncbi:MAG TPA: glycosyltransferase [Methylococcaceae bacterium]|jgi:rSAM/selenodomain-associated transferase 1|nr:glycosyltransferase [Methylococcaceae bacterium]HIN69367.1 glycosyltransferase [Methylococcales bacterium]HIA46337.1 glycosyltransferase [Methylococcaceae bacterium]HIB63322.1 glycosyltransferase [Methylococcaceae bacterium]HIO12397.1 glycosyltransferase [Methylococcales bacterium]
MPYLFNDARILAFSKAPTPGQVKTRLCPPLTDQAAAQVHKQLTISTLEMACKEAICPTQLWCSPSPAHKFFTTLKGNFPITLEKQVGNNLGEKMHHAFCSSLQSARHVILIGSDSPSLSPEVLKNAIMALKNRHDITLAPATDGGYALIGLNRPQELIFKDINWGKEDVLKTTLKRIKSLTLNYYELPLQWDVDTPEDLIRYQALKQNIP